jgi:hypothetical protein
MFTVGPTFFSSAGSDGLTRFQVAFAGASSADVSTYAIGSGTNDEFVLADGSASAVFDSDANPKSLVYDNAGLKQLADDSPLTYELFFTASDPGGGYTFENPGHAIKFAQFTTHLNGISFYIQALPNDTDVKVVQSGYSDVIVTAAIVYGVQNHLAMVNRTTGVMDFYLNGVRIITGRDDATTLASTGTFQFGGVGRGDTKIAYAGGRVRREEVYSGASPGAPSSPAAWGTP